MFASYPARRCSSGSILSAAVLRTRVRVDRDCERTRLPVAVSGLFISFLFNLFVPLDYVLHLFVHVNFDS